MLICEKNLSLGALSVVALCVAALLLLALSALPPPFGWTPCAVRPPLRHFASPRPARHAGRIIHLPSRRDREANVSRLIVAAASVGVELEVMSATDGRACADLPVSPFWDFSIPPGHVRRHLRGGEQGCLASFLRIIDALPSGGLSAGAFFLEDDAVMDAEGFHSMSTVLEKHAEAPVLLHARRAYPAGWPRIAETVEAEAASADEVEAGWSRIAAPNYSNALFAVTRKGASQLREWTQSLKLQGLHRLPADDLISAACGAHEGVYRPPMADGWASAPPPVLVGLAPREPLSDRLSSSSDTERREPLGGGAAGTCSLV